MKKLVLFFVLLGCFSTQASAQTFYTSRSGVVTEWTNIHTDQSVRFHESGKHYWVVIDNGSTQRSAMFEKSSIRKSGNSVIGTILSMDNGNALFNVRMIDNDVVGYTLAIDGLKANFGKVLP